MAHQPREHFLGELARLETQALGGLDLVCESLDRVLEAVQHCDIELAEMVIADDDRIDGRYLEVRSEEHTSELQPHDNLVCRLPLEKTSQLLHRGACRGAPSLLAPSARHSACP